jgi:hypothetical protein
MDKKETSRLLNNLVTYNKVDINNLRTEFPEVGSAFMNVIFAIDEEYGSGSMSKQISAPAPASMPNTTLTFKEFGEQFIGKYLYRTNSKEWYYFDSMVRANEPYEYDYKTYSNSYGRNSNVSENGTWSKSSLEKLLSGNDVNDWKLFNLKVGDKVKIPNTKQGSSKFISNVILNAIKNNQDYLFINSFQKDGVIALYDSDTSKLAGDFFIMQDLEPYEGLGFKVGDYFTSKSWADDDWVKITEITPTDIKVSDKEGNSFTFEIRLVTDGLNSGYYTMIPDPTQNTSTSTTGVNYITAWRPDWKAMGLRPSPSRKASLEKIDALGLGNDGIVYEVIQDKKGTQKWKKIGFSLYNTNVRKEFSSIYDKNLLIDQLTYENSQLDKDDIGYKENEKLIKLLIKEVQ